MQTPRFLILLSLLFLLLPSSASAISPDSTDPREIMNAAEARETPDRVTTQLIFVVIDSAGRKRTRVVQSRSIKFPEGTRQLMLFESPADVRNTGLLSIDYDAGEKEDDQWLYLPSLRKSTRISSGNKSGSFMGTDMSYSDMTKADPAGYEYKLLKAEVKVDREPCWLIESRPKSDKLKEETGYIKSHIWVSKEKLLPLRVKNWVKKGKKIKLIKFSGHKKIDGFWIAEKITAQTKQGKTVESRTVILFKDYKTNQASVKSDDFNQRRLEKGL